MWDTPSVPNFYSRDKYDIWITGRPGGGLVVPSFPLAAEVGVRTPASVKTRFLTFLCQSKAIYS